VTSDFSDSTAMSNNWELRHVSVVMIVNDHLITNKNHVLRGQKPGPPVVGVTPHLSFHLPHFPILNFANAVRKCGIYVGWTQAVDVRVESYDAVCCFIGPTTSGRKYPHVNYSALFMPHSLTSDVYPARFPVK